MDNKKQGPKTPQEIFNNLPLILKDDFKIDKDNKKFLVNNQGDLVKVTSFLENIPKQYERLQKLEKKYSRLNTVNQMANLIPDPFDVRTSVQQQELSDRDIKKLKAMEKYYRKQKQEGGKLVGDQKELDVNNDGQISGEDFKLLREQKQEGGSMDDQMQKVMNQPMLPDEEMEDNYLDFIIDEALDEEEEDMLMSKLEQDEQLSMLFDKVLEVASEFAGSGPVEGPGSGVSDSIPARLSDGEFVFTAKATEQIGADELMRMMKDAEAAADRQGMQEGGMMMEEEEVDQFGRPIDSDIARDELKKNMMSVNPRYR
jgi:hypothetical protein